MRIYVDFDDVLCETALALSSILEREFGRTVPFESIFSFNLGESFNLTPRELDHLMEVMHRPEELMALAPMANAADTLRHWMAGDYEIDIVTGRPAATWESSLAWLKAHDVPHTSLTFVDKYARPQEAPPHVPLLTLDALARRPYCLAIDDAPRMITFLREQMDMPVAVVDRPWNRAIGNGDITRCRDWADIAARFARP